MRKWKMLALVLALTSCAGSDIYPYHMKNLVEACKDNGGWAVIYGDVALTARCVDGKYIHTAIMEKK